MKFYTEQHRYYCGIDLHARSMYVCVLDQAGERVVHRNIPTEPAPLLRLLKPYRKGVVICVECLFCWYWMADLCAEQGIPFVLGHALYMKAIHGGKSKNDKIDSYKIAALLRGGNLPQAYVYPSGMRATRDVLRRRLFFVRFRGGLYTHIQSTNTQYNLEPFEKRIDQPGNRIGLLEHFEDEDVQMSVAANSTLIDSCDETIAELELFLENRAKVHDGPTFYLLRSVPGIGRILSLTILYEIHEISRFPSVGEFLSWLASTMLSSSRPPPTGAATSGLPANSSRNRRGRRRSDGLPNASTPISARSRASTSDGSPDSRTGSVAVRGSTTSSQLRSTVDAGIQASSPRSAVGRKYLRR